MALPVTLQAARLRLAQDRPYLRTALWALTPVERPGLGTLAIDRWWRLYYDPAAIESWSIDHLVGILYHEVCHPLRAHHERAEALGANPQAYNVVGDIEINDDLRDEGVELPHGALYPETFDLPPHKLAEEYYWMLEPASGLGSEAQAGRQLEAGAAGQGDGARAGDRADGPNADTSAQGGTAPGDGRPGDGPPPSLTAAGGGTASEPKLSPGGDTGGSHTGDARESLSQASSVSPSASSQGPHRPVDTRDALGTHPTGESAQTQTPAPTRGRCGSCAHGHQEPWEAGPPGESGVPGIGHAEAEIIRRQVAEEIRRCAAQGRGNIPAHWRRWAEEKLNPKVDWRRVLAAAVRAALADATGAVDYSYKRPSRRQHALPNVVLPSLRHPLPEVAVVVDTSGSVGDAELSQALAEVAGVIRAAGAKHGVRVLAVDAAVHSCRRVFRPEQVELLGGGGTDMGVGIEAAAKLRPRPHVIVVITDGLTPWPTSPPQGVRVVTAILGNKGGQGPTWAKNIYITR